MLDSVAYSRSAGRGPFTENDMSNINTRNYQLNLAFNDTDLRTPKHDAIMHWLQAWVKEADNVRRLLRPKFSHRIEAIRHELTPDSLSLMKGSPDAHSITSDFSIQHKESSADVKAPWQGEPGPDLRFHQMQWELPLKGERGEVIGFVDLWARYSVGEVLRRVTTKSHRLDSLEPKERHSRFLQTWSFSPVGDHVTYEQQLTGLSLFFEVKTEIRSVGELMRQLQLYRSSSTFRGHAPSRLIVVAPANNEAASVCLDHGIPFIEYRP